MNPVESPISNSTATTDQFAFQIRHESAYQETREAYEANLWSNLRTRLNRAEFFLLPGRIDLALKYLQKARDFCARYGATEAMEQKCQETEDIIRGWRRNGYAGQRQRLKRRSSDSYLQSPVNRMFSPQYYKASDVDSGPQRSLRTNSVGSYNEDGTKPASLSESEDSLFHRLRADVTRPRVLSPESSPIRETRRPPLELEESSQQLIITTAPPTQDDSDFVRIDDALPQIRDKGKIVRHGASELSHRRGNDNSAKLIEWQRSLPDHYTQFKPSEEASPRRHSMPQDSPQPETFANHSRERRGSIHRIPEPLSHHDLDAPTRPLTNTGSSPNASVSSDLRRHSKDEVSPVLFGTPSLEKLNTSLAANPHTNTDSPIASRIRRLSTEDPSRVPLPHSPGMPVQQSESPPTSPLSQSFTPDDFLVTALITVKPTANAGQSCIAPAPLHLGIISPSSKPVSGLDTSPHTPSPLREHFSPPIEPTTTDVVEPAQPTLRCQPTHSRIPVLARTGTAQFSGGCAGAIPAGDNEQPSPLDANALAPNSTFSSSSRKSLSDPVPASVRARQVSFRIDQASSASSQPTTTAARPKPRRSSTETRVLSMAAEYDAKIPPIQGLGRTNTDSRQPQCRPVVPKAVTNARRPPWQRPGKAKATTGTSG